VTTVRAALVTPLSGPLAEHGRAGAIALGLWAEQSTVDLAVFDAHPDPACRRRGRAHRTGAIQEPRKITSTVGGPDGQARPIWW
jgi:hypothetical protein